MARPRKNAVALDNSNTPVEQDNNPNLLDNGKTFLEFKEADLFVSDDEIEKALHKADVSATKLKYLYQRIACSIIKRIGETNDIRLVDKCLDQMAAHGVRKQPMVKFFTSFAPISLDDKNAIMFDKNKKVKLGEAMTTPWWKTMPVEANAPKAFNLAAMLEVLEARSEKRYENLQKGDVISAEMIIKLRQLVQFAKDEEAKIMATIAHDEVKNKAA